MSAQYVRDYYGVPAKRGMRITFAGTTGRIVGFQGQYLRARLDDGGGIITLHPTWKILYHPEQRHV